MAQKKDIPILQIIIVLAVIVAGVYLVKTYVLKPATDTKKDEEEKAPVVVQNNSNNDSSSSSNSSNIDTTPNLSSSGLPIKGNNTVLKRGDKAAEVKYIQYEYNKRHAKPLFKIELDEDGVFGANTEKAVLEIMGQTQTTYAKFLTKIKSLYPEDNRNWYDDIQLFSFTD